jgi:xylulokinase
MVTEKSLMSSTGYFDINNDTLFTDILDFAEISKHLIPEVLDCGERVGKILPEVATEIGLHNGIEIFTGAMDQVAGALGAGNFNSEIMTETTGTALVVCASTKNPNFTLLTKPPIYRHVESGNYLVLSFSETAGLILKWFKDEFCQGETEKYGSDVYVELDKMASTVAAATDGLFLLPQFSNGGGFYGITLDTKRAHIIRAILEGIAFSLQSNIEIVEEMGMRSQKIISLGGGSKSALWCQIKADILGKEIVTLNQEESASLGAAILGGVGYGTFNKIDSIESINLPKKIYTPIPKNVEAYKKGTHTYKRLIEKFYSDEMKNR